MLDLVLTLRRPWTSLAYIYPHTHSTPGNDLRKRKLKMIEVYMHFSEGTYIWGSPRWIWSHYSPHEFCWWWFELSIKTKIFGRVWGVNWNSRDPWLVSITNIVPTFPFHLIAKRRPISFLLYLHGKRDASAWYRGCGNRIHLSFSWSFYYFHFKEQYGVALSRCPDSFTRRKVLSVSQLWGSVYKSEAIEVAFKNSCVLNFTQFSWNLFRSIHLPWVKCWKQYRPIEIPVTNFIAASKWTELS